MSVMVIACYRPKKGAESALFELMKTHLPTLRSQGLVDEGPSLAGRAKDGTIIEIFNWRSQAAIAAAHQNKAVAAMWEAFGEVCDFVAIGDVSGAKEPFTELEPIDLN